MRTYVRDLAAFVQMYGVGGGDYGSMVDIIAAVQTFLHASGAASLPSLDEYAIMLDKVVNPPCRKQLPVHFWMKIRLCRKLCFYYPSRYVR